MVVDIWGAIEISLAFPSKGFPGKHYVPAVHVPTRIRIGRTRRLRGRR